MSDPPAPTPSPPPSGGRRRSAHWPSLVWTLVRTDFKNRYNRTLGGFFWALAKPTAMFVVLWTIFSFVFASQPSYKLDLIVGLFLYEFFAEATRSGLISLHLKGFLFAKARLPAWIVVVTSSANALLTLAVFSLAMIVFIGASVGRWPDPAIAACYGLYMVLFVAVAIGISIATSVLFLRYRDLNQVWDVVLQAGFFVAPVVYPLGILPESAHPLLFLWPPTAFIELSRDLLVDGGLPTAKALGILVACSLGIFAVGAAIYRQLAPRAAELV